MPALVASNPLILRPADDLLATHPYLKRMAGDLARKYAADHRVMEEDLRAVTEEDLRAMGAALWEALGPEAHEALTTARRQAAGNAVLPIRIVSADTVVQALPWETLYHPDHGFLGRHPAFALSRSLDTAALLPPPEPGPLRVLHFTSLPDDLDPETARLNVEAERVAVQEALLPYLAQGWVWLESPDDGRWETFQQLMQAFQPHIVFLSGHGHYFHEPHSGETWAEFLFEDAHGRSLPIRAAAPPDTPHLTAAFAGLPVQAVILSACESGKAAPSADLTAGLAGALAAAGVPHVVGMQESLLDLAGIAFAQAFFAALLSQEDDRVVGERLDVALQRARAAMTHPLADLPPTYSQETGLSALRERSLGQWPLPMLLTAAPGHPLIRWDFVPRLRAPHREVVAVLSDIPQPPRFVGRRAELRRWKAALAQGEPPRLIIAGLGGSGKTALAGKIARDLAARGFRAYAWSARAETPALRAASWRAFLLELELALNEENRKRYTAALDEAQRSALLLRLLAQQDSSPLLIFLDNLESLQDPETRALQDPAVAAFVEAARETPNLRLLLTSRWVLPGWPEAETLLLASLPYSDFLALARTLALEEPPRFPPAFLADREKMRRAYTALGGNPRHLEWLGALLKAIPPQDEAAFLEGLETTTAQGREDMALEMLWEHLPPDAHALLARAPVYGAPVPAEGLRVLAPDLPGRGAPALATLRDFSLLEATANPAYGVVEYRVPPPVVAFLAQTHRYDDALRWREGAADYLLWLLRYERPHDLAHAARTWAALRNAGRDEAAHRLALDILNRPLQRAGLYRVALEYLEPACHSAEPRTQAWALHAVGTAYHALGEYDMALQYYQQALAILRELRLRVGEGISLNSIGKIYHARGEYDTAFQYYQQALAILEKLGVHAGKGDTLRNIGQIYHARGDYNTALKYYEQALAILRDTGDREREGGILNDIASLHWARGEYDMALKYYQQALDITREVGDQSGEGDILNNIASLYWAQGEYGMALQYYQRALTISLKIGDLARTWTTLNNIATIYWVWGEYDTALQYYQRALDITHRIGDRSGEGTTLNNIGQVYKTRRKYDKALKYYQQSRAIQRAIGDRAGEGVTLNNIGQIYYALGSYETALQYYQQALAIMREIGDRASEGAILNNIGQIYGAREEYDTALRYYQQALAISREIGDRAGLCPTLVNIGNIYVRKGAWREALASWVAAYRIAKEIQQAEVLQALDTLGRQFLPQLGLSPGLAGWEQLAQQMEN